MSSRLAQAVAQPAAKNTGKARDFFVEVCRCLPFVQRLHKLDEIVTLRELRAIVKSRFTEFKDVKDPRVAELLIFKAREELECYLMMHKQRHHAITEYIEPYRVAQQAVHKPTGNSAFLDSFFDTAYPQIAKKL